MEAGEDGQASFGGLRATDLGALHPHEGQDGTEEAQTHGSDHQPPAHLDVGFKTEKLDFYHFYHFKFIIEGPTSAASQMYASCLIM